MYKYFVRFFVVLGGFLWAFVAQNTQSVSGQIISHNNLLHDGDLKSSVAVYYGNDVQRPNLNKIFTNIQEINNAIRDLEFRRRSVTNPAEAKQIGFLITQLLEMRNYIQRAKNTLTQMGNLSSRYQPNKYREYNVGMTANPVHNMQPFIGQPMSYGETDAGFESYNAYPEFDSREARGATRSFRNQQSPQTLNSAYYIQDTAIRGATNMQLDLADADVYNADLEDFVDAGLPINRVNPYSNNLQLSESGKAVIKARFELAEYLFFNGLKARGLFVIRDLLHSISVEDTWSMEQIIQLGDKLATSRKYRDMAVHVFKLGFKKYRGLPVAAVFLLRAGMLSYYLKNTKDACLSFMTIRDGYPYDKKTFIRADVMAKKLHCPPHKVGNDMVW